MLFCGHRKREEEAELCADKTNQTYFEGVKGGFVYGVNEVFKSDFSRVS